MAYGLTPQDAIPILSDSEDERSNIVDNTSNHNNNNNTSSSDDEDALGVTIKKERSSNSTTGGGTTHSSSLAAAHRVLPLAPVFHLHPDSEPEDWQRASYLASQRAYADIARFFRSGDAYFISLSLTPWESAGPSTEVLDFGWAHLTQDFGRSRAGFDWQEALEQSTQGRNGMSISKEEWDATDRVFSAFKRAKSRVSWKPRVVHYAPLERKDHYNHWYYPNNKAHFLFRAFAERVNPYPRSNVFHRHTDGTHVDRQDFGINEFNRKLGDLSSKKPVFLLTHCMEEDVNFLSKLGIAWNNMNLSYPLSPWFTPKEDAEWLRDHAYWRFAWDFARPEPRANASTGNGVPASSNRANERPHKNIPRRPSSAAAGRSAAASSEDDDRPVDPRLRQKARGEDRSFVFERARFTGGGPARRNGHSSDESESWHRRVPAPRRSFSPAPAPKKPRLLTRHQFYKPGTIHVVDIYALMEVIPKFSERSASYYPTGSSREQMNAGSTAEGRQRIAEQKRKELENDRAKLLERATSMISKCTGTSQKKRDFWLKSLLAAAARTGVLDEKDGHGDQFKFWHGGNDAMYMLAILSNLVAEHPLPERAPTPPPPPPRSELPSRSAFSSSIRVSGSGVGRSAVQPRTRRADVPISSSRSDATRGEIRSRTSLTQGTSSSRIPASLPPQRPRSLLQSGNRRNATTDAVEVPMTAPSDIRNPVNPRRLVPPFEQAVIRLQQDEERRRSQMVQSGGPAETQSLQPQATKRARPVEPSAPISIPTQHRARVRSAAVLASNRIENLPSAVRNGVAPSDSSSLSSLDDDDDDDNDDDDDDDDDVRPRRKHLRVEDSPSPEPEALNSRHQFKPFYKHLHQLFQDPAIYISFAYRNGAPTNPYEISEVGICVLDASRADSRESLQLNTSHLLVREFLNSARPEAKTDFRFGVGTDPIKIDKSESLPSGTRVAKKQHITKAIHEVLKGALDTDRRVFVVLSMLDDEVSFGHNKMIGPDMWPVFYDWRTLQLNALGKDNESMFVSNGLWSRVQHPFRSSGSVPGTRGRKIFTIEIGSLFAAVNPEEDPTGGAGAAGEFPNIPFSQICDLLGVQPEANRGLDNAGNAAFFTMQAMLEFAYGPTDLEVLKKEIKTRKEAQDVRAVEAQI